jgi:hypothetical protein
MVLLSIVRTTSAPVPEGGICPECNETRCLAERDPITEKPVAYCPVCNVSHRLVKVITMDPRKTVHQKGKKHSNDTSSDFDRLVNAWNRRAPHYRRTHAAICAKEGHDWAIATFKGEMHYEVCLRCLKYNRE